MAIYDAFITSKTILLLETFLLEFGCLSFDFIIKDLNKLRFGIGSGIIYVVITEDTEQLWISE